MDIYLHGEIGDDSWQGAHEWGIVGQRFIREQLDKSGDEEINLYIHSVGGSVFEGWGMYYMLKESGKKINTYVNGLAASMATVFPFLGDNRSITKGSQQMIHNPWSFAAGNADDLEQTAKELREIENEMIDFYHANTGYDKDMIKAEMKEETYFGADLSKAKGFSTNIIEYNTELAEDAKSKIAKAKEYYSKNDKNQNGTAKEFLALMKAINNKDENMEISEKLKGLKDKFLSKKVVARDYPLNEGGQISTDSEDPIAQGQAVTIDGQTAPDGQYNLQDGLVVSVEGGIVTSVMDAETEFESKVNKLGSDMNAMAELLEAVLMKSEESDKEVESLKKEYEEKLEKMSAFASKFKQDVDIPSEKFSKKPEEAKENPVAAVLGSKNVKK